MKMGSQISVGRVGSLQGRAQGQGGDSYLLGTTRFLSPTVRLSCQRELCRASLPPLCVPNHCVVCLGCESTLLYLDLFHFSS